MRVLARIVLSSLLLSPALHAADMAAGGHAEEFSTRAGLPSLSNGTPRREVRVWRSVGLLDEVQGWVVRESQVDVYAGLGSGPIKLVASFVTSSASTTLASLVELDTYDRQWLSCKRMHDGWSLDVEAHNGNDYFNIGSANPNLCRDGPPYELWQAYKDLRQITHGAP